MNKRLKELIERIRRIKDRLNPKETNVSETGETSSSDKEPMLSNEPTRSYAPYMSSPNDWLCVHATSYEPKKNSDGEMYIETTAMATDYRFVRSTVHFTLNHVVVGHTLGNWDDASIVVLAPFKDVVEKNSKPEMVCMVDTYFEPNPDKGLVLPESTYIVRPGDNNGKLFEIGEHSATYKTDNYTKEDEEYILSSDSSDKDKFYRLLSGDVSEVEAQSALGYDKKLIDVYNKSKDKKAFMRGIFEENRFIILNKLLRDYVVNEATRKMGFYSRDSRDGRDEIVKKSAKKAGFNATSHNAEHFNSLEGDIEHESCFIVKLVDVLKTKDVDKITKFFNERKNERIPMGKEIIANITDNKPIPDVYNVYDEIYKRRVESDKMLYETCKTISLERVQKEELERIQKEEEGLEVYKPNLYKTLKRHSQKINSELELSLNELKQNPENYALLQRNLRRLVAQQSQKLPAQSLER